jgi:hypothetical protein
MQGSIDQALALTVSGNALLQGLEIGPFWPEAKVFVFCSEVRFVDGSSIVAGNPALWLERLAGEGAGLKLRIAPRNDPSISAMMSLGFANGGPRLLIEAIVPGRPATCWEPSWEVTGDPFGPEPDRRIWTVSYVSVPSRSLPQWTAERALREIEADLASALDALTDFVDRFGPEEAMPGWEDQFRSARMALEAQPEWQESDPRPPGFLSPDAMRLLHACREGWVFGGMGAWNDGAYWGSAEADGDRLSETLFALLNEAVAAAANSSRRPR